MLSPQEICQKILGVHEGARWVKVFDRYGKIVFEGKKDHVEPYLSKEAMESLRTLWFQVIQGVVGRVAQYWGQAQHLHIQFLKVGLFGFPYVGGTVVVIAEPYVPATIISEIQNILKPSQR
jgi:hypothetical protein